MNNRLGKGISALINSQKIDEQEYLDGFIPIDKIKINPDQPRKYFDKESLNELVESIREKGILQPITLRALDDNFFELIAGERRLKAVKILDLKTIPAYIIKVESDLEKLELALIENIQRNDLNPIEEGEAYYSLNQKYNLTHAEISKRVGKSRIEVTRTMELIKLPKSIKKSMIENFNNIEFPFTRGHARTILALKDSLKIQTLYNRILKENLSVRKTEGIVKKINKGDKKSPPSISENSNLQDEKSLTNWLITKVEVVSNKKNKGYIKILFKSERDKDRIINIIKSSKK